MEHSSGTYAYIILSQIIHRHGNKRLVPGRHFLWLLSFVSSMWWIRKVLQWHCRTKAFQRAWAFRRLMYWRIGSLTCKRENELWSHNSSYTIVFLRALHSPWTIVKRYSKPTMLAFLDLLSWVDLLQITTSTSSLWFVFPFALAVSLPCAKLSLEAIG